MYAAWISEADIGLLYMRRVNVSSTGTITVGTLNSYAMPGGILGTAPFTMAVVHGSPNTVWLAFSERDGSCPFQNAAPNTWWAGSTTDEASPGAGNHRRSIYRQRLEVVLVPREADGGGIEDKESWRATARLFGAGRVSSSRGGGDANVLAAVNVASSPCSPCSASAWTASACAWLCAAAGARLTFAARGGDAFARARGRRMSPTGARSSG